MLKCSGCGAQFDDAPDSGICPECGDLLHAPGALTEVDIGGTIELPATGKQDPGATADPPQNPDAVSGDDTAATMPFVEAGDSATGDSDPSSNQAPPGDQTAATIELPAAGDSSQSDPTAPTIELPAASDSSHGDPTAPTMELPDSGSSGGGDQTAATVELPGAGGKRPAHAAPRKLSVANRRLITNTWQSAAGSASSRSSLKVEGREPTGTGSSLVVNPRGVRSAHSRVRTASGADYELLEVIGKGGMGVVYSARQASVDRTVAVKMIRPSVATDIERREKFLSEAVVTGDLDHPNIVPIYDLGTNESNALFYSMKRVKGTPWSKAIGKNSLNDNLDILLKVADAVAFAHANGVVHRDLKPDNVMLGDYGEVLVMDWGLALATSAFSHAEFVTAHESMGGTPAYMAPEMVTGPFELIGPPADIYLLGALLYEVVTGRVPHGGKTAQECLLAAARNEIAPCEESGELIDVAYRAMATEPSARYASVQEFQAAIRDYLSHCESISLSVRADKELAHARESGSYEGFSHALFAFQEALALWDGNQRAREGIGEAKLAYASNAKQKGDFELGISLLEPGNPEHDALRTELNAALRERDARHNRLKLFRRTAAALVVVVFAVVSVSLFVVAGAKNRETAAKEQAIKDKDAAERAEQAAELARQQELEQKNKAIAAEKRARDEEQLARAAEAKAREAEEEERTQRMIAVEAKNKAREEQRKAVLAKIGEEYAAYTARIGMAAARIDENAFDTADSLLEACVPQGADDDDFRGWEWGYLKRLGRRGTNYPATGTITSVAFAPDGRWFATAGEDAQAHLWNRETGQPIRAIDHGGYVHDVAVSPDGRLIATAGADGLVRVARVDNGQVVYTLRGHEDRVFDVEFSPRSGRWLATASRDRTVRVWNLASGAEVPASPLRGHAWWVWSAAFSPNEDRIVSAGQDGKVIVWPFDPNAEPREDAERTVFVGHEGPVFAAAFAPDGARVASAGYDKRVLVWKPEEIDNVDLRQIVANQPTAPQPARAFEGHSAPVRDVSFSADGQSVLSAGDDNTVRIWDVMTGKVDAVLRGHSRPVQSCAFSPDGRNVVSVGQEGQIKSWRILENKEIRTPQGRLLVGHQDAILQGAFSPDGQRIVTASRDHTARIYDAQSGESLFELKEGHDFLASRAIYFNGDRWLLTAAGDNSVRVWDATSGSELCAIEGTGLNAAVAVTTNARYILTGTSANSAGQANVAGANVDAQAAGAQPKIALWKIDDTGTSVQRHQFTDPGFGTGHRGKVTIVAISPDDRLLFSGDDAGVGKLWSARDGAEVATLRGHPWAISDAIFTPDGRRLLTASYDGTVAQWDVATGQELPGSLSHVNPRHSDAYDAPVEAMALAPDGRLLVTLSEDTNNGVLERVVRLWNLDRAEVAGELYRGPQTITSVAFADDAGTVLAAGMRQFVDAKGIETRRTFVRRWNLATMAEDTAPDGGPFLNFDERRESVWAAIEAPHGGVLTVGGNGASLWEPGITDKPQLVFKPHSGVTAAGFSHDGALIVTGSTDRRAKIWNARTGKTALQLPHEHTRPITSASFSPRDNRLLVTASHDGTARIWQVDKRQVLHVLNHASDAKAIQAVRCAIFSPDGTQIATGGDDGTIRLWGAADGRALRTLDVQAPVLALAYSADGKWIIAGAEDGRAVVFDVATATPLVRYQGHTAAVRSVAFSPDGSRALTGSSDRTAKLWDTIPAEVAGPESDDTSTDKEAQPTGPRAGKEILTLKHHDQAVTSVAFSPDGRSILTTGLDGTAVLWLADAWRDAPGD